MLRRNLFAFIFPKHIISAKFTNLVKPAGYLQQPEGGSQLFRSFALYGGVPAILIAMGNCIFNDSTKKENVPPVKYEYLHRQTKAFPWGDGDKSFFEK